MNKIIITPPAKVAANQTNAQLSTGPKSPEGKAIVSQNAVKHSLTSKKLVLSGEEQSEFDRLLASAKDHYQPETEIETSLTRQTVEFQWRLDRATRIETALFDRTLTDIREENPEIDDDEAMALVFIDSRYTSRIRLFMRYHGQLQRGWAKSIFELEKVIEERKRKEVENAAVAVTASRLKQINNMQNRGFVSHLEASAAPADPQPSAPAVATAQMGGAGR